jgi:hypothetical protein
MSKKAPIEVELDVFVLPVHPAAEIFPRLDADELAELAADIAEHGLRESLVVQRVNGEALLIDGRNRREACRLAGIAPTVRWLDPETNAAEFIFSANVTRRHLTKGQRAMAVAQMYPWAKHGGDRKSSSVTELEKGEIGKGRLSEARAVLQWAPERVPDVMAGGSLEKAYKAAIEKRSESAANAHDRAPCDRDAR